MSENNPISFDLDQPIITSRQVLDSLGWKLVEAEYDLSWSKYLQAEVLFGLLPLDVHLMDEGVAILERFHEVHNLLREESDREERLLERLHRPKKSVGKGNRPQVRQLLKKLVKDFEDYGDATDP